MRLLLFFFISLFICNSTNSQIRRLRLSPLQTTEQKIGITDLTIECSRPAMKGREIFGELVPYGKAWRTGANRNTKITFSKEVLIGDHQLPAGTYAIFTIPNEDVWEVMFYTDTDNWDVPEIIDTTKIAAKIMVTPFALNRNLETFTMSVDNISETSADLGIAWDDVYVGIPIDFQTRKHMDALVDAELNRDRVHYHVAAAYYEERNIELDKAKILMEKAMSLTDEKHVWDYRVYAIILDKLGLRKEAIEAARTSLDLAKKTNHENGIKLNTEDLKKWGAL